LKEGLTKSAFSVKLNWLKQNVFAIFPMGVLEEHFSICAIFDLRQ
jgi:hypothetical protein